MPLVRAEALTRVYRRGRAAPVHALAGVDLEVAAGEFVALLGASGSGKSTLLNLIGGLDRPTSGRVAVGDRDLGSLGSRALALYRRREVGFVFQSFHLSPRMSAWENVALPLRFAGTLRRERRRRADAALDRVGLRDRAEHEPARLSGGEQQRVALARSLVASPSLLLADEPTGNLDSATGAQVMGLLDEANRAGTTVLLVTHDEALAARHARRSLRLVDGRWAEERDA